MRGDLPAPNIRPAGVARRVQALRQRIIEATDRAGRPPDGITVIGVTKMIAPEVIQQAYQAGIKDFGENRIQEARDKITQLSVLQPPPAWHLVGHLQTNKVKVAAEIFSFIHSVDSLRLAEAISHHAEHDVPILIQVNVSGEASKGGFSSDEAISAVARISGLPHLETKGLMTIAPYTDDPEQVRPIFRRLRQLRDSLGLEHLSMGMTDDFEIAIEEGATMVRIGRAIFGEREG